MVAWLLHLWERVRSSLWFVPTAMSLAAGALALLSTHLDVVLAESGRSLPLVYPGDQDGARTLLSTVASSMITVAGVAFSVTIVALSLASSQFGPRLLQNFMRDRGNQLVLGTFIATFLFCLIALGQVGRDAAVVPAVSATLALLLAIASLAMLIYFIHHVSSSIRAEQVITGVARDLERDVDRLIPDAHDERTDEDVAPDEALEDALRVTAAHSGYVQRVDEQSLLWIAEQEDLVLRATCRAGRFVVQGQTMARARGCAELSEELAERIQACFILGRERTREQDPVHGIHQLVEVAVRALSPGINDPYTAISCVDWLGAVLCKVGRRPLRTPQRRDSEGRARLFLDPIDFQGLLDAAFDQIRQCARAIPAVSIRMLEMLEQIGASVAGRKERVDAVRAQADSVLRGALSEEVQERDRRDLERRHQAVVDVLERSTGAAAPRAASSS